MNFQHQIGRRLRALFGRKRFEVDLAAELRAHLEMQEAANRAAGMSADEAHYAAQRQFGSVDQIKEQARDQRGWVWLEQWWRDLCFSLRTLRRAPAFSLAVLSTLALCIGPNTAILSVLYALVLKPLPFREPDRLVQVYNVATKSNGARSQSSVPQYQDFTAHADLFEGFAGFNLVNYTLGEDTSPVRATAVSMSADFFAVLGLKPLLGRFFTPGEHALGQDHVIVLTKDFWETHFLADPGVVGRDISLGGESFTIVGVAPASVEQVYTTIRFFKPYAIAPNEDNPQARYRGKLLLLGRLKPGVTLAAAKAQLEVLEQRFYSTEAAPQVRAFLDQGGYQIGIGLAQDELVAPVKTPLLLLQGGALFVLLIGCVNVANLLLARANSKRLELSIRHALGAGRVALLRQMLGESLVLTTVAVGAGIGLAIVVLRLLNHYLPLVMHGVPTITLDLPLLGWVCLAALVIALVVGAIPFVLLWRSGLRVGDTRTASAGSGARAVGSLLVVAQVAFALILLVGAGLLIRSFAKVVAVDPGFDAAHIVQGRVALPLVRFKDQNDNVAIQQRILAAMKEIPGVETACLVTDYGVASSFRTAPFIIHGAEGTPGQNQSLVYLNIVSPEFFATMGIRLLEGRVFSDSDDVRKIPVVIVDQAFAERHFPGRSAVGRELALGIVPPPAGMPWPRIVGVVARAHLTGLEGRDGWPFLYYPINQLPNPGFSLLLRTARPVSDVLTEMRVRLREIDPTLPLYSTGSLQTSLDEMLTNRRGLVLLLGLFAGMALLLAALGLYGVLTYDVSQRTRELGIRAALGASRDQIIGLILRQGLWRTGAGIAAGLAGAVFLTRFLRKLLFDVSPVDPAAYIAVTGLLLLVALLASWLPARRATKVDPVVALRAE